MHYQGITLSLCYLFLRTLYCIKIVCKSALRIPVVTINYSPGFLLPASLSRRRGGKRSGPGGNYWRSMLPTAQNCGLLGVHFQSPRRNFGVGSMRNAPWVLSSFLHKCWERGILITHGASLASFA